MEAYQAVLMAIVALLVGVLLPVLFQLALTLRSVRAVLAQAGPALTSITATVERLDRLTSRLEEGDRIENTLAAIDSLARTVGKLQDTARMASSVGAALVPAVTAAMLAWRGGGDEGQASAGVAPQPSATGGKEAA